MPEKSTRRVVLATKGRFKRSVRAVRLFGHLAVREPHAHFVVPGASLLFDDTYFGASFALDMAFLWFHTSPPPIVTYFHKPHVLLSGLISPHYGSAQCGHSASASVDLHPTSDAIVKVKTSMQMTSVQMKINHLTRAA